MAGFNDYTMKKKILFASNLYPSSAEPRRALFNAQLVKAVGQKCDVRVIAPYFWFPGRRLLPAKETLDGVDVWHPRIFYIPRLLIHQHWLLYRLFVKGCFRKMINEFEPDHVMLGFLYPDVVAMGGLCREMGVDYSVRVNGSDFYTRIKDGKFRALVLGELMKAPRVFCPGEALKDAMVADGVDGGKIISFDNGVDGEMFKYRTKDEVREKCLPADLHRFSQMKDAKTVLFVGNLVAVKNPGLAIDAFEKIISRRGAEDAEGDESCHLVVIGEGRERKRLERLVRNNGIKERVHFLGSRSHEEVALWMNVADCLCLSSRSEGMPNVVVEALTSGLPVVATDVGDCRRILEDEQSARVVVSDAADMMARALDDVLKMDADRAAMAERYQGKYSWGETASRIIGLLE